MTALLHQLKLGIISIVKSAGSVLDNIRLTETGDFRITEDGDYRELE